MCGSPKIPAQDPRFAEASMREIQLAERQYQDYVAPGGERDYMRRLGDEALGIYRSSADSSQRMSDYQLGQMRRNDDRYWGTVAPFEDRLRREVESMDSEAFRDKQVGIARADVHRTFDAAEAQGMRTMSRMGIDPTDGRYLDAIADGGRARALAEVTAANKTRQAAMQMGLANKMQLYGGMKGMAGLGATSAQLALGASGQSMAAAGGLTGTGRSVLGANNDAFGTYATGVNGGVSGYNGYYGNAVTAYKATADNDPMKTMLGSAAGAGMSAVASYAMTAF